MSADNDTARICCWVPVVQHSIYMPSRQAHGSKPAAAACGSWYMEQAGRKTEINTVPLRKSWRQLNACSGNIKKEHTYIHTFNGHFSRTIRVSRILLQQETVSGSGISWAICKSVPHSRQITMPAPHHSVFYRPDALPAAQPIVSKHQWHKKEK